MTGAWILWRRILLLMLGGLICVYAILVMIYVQGMPDIGLRCTFDPSVKFVHSSYIRTDGGRYSLPQVGDTITTAGERTVQTWPQLLRGLIALRSEAPVTVTSLEEADRQHLTYVELNGEPLLRLQFKRATETGDQTLACWCLVGQLPMEELSPSIAWFILQLGLFVVGMVVFWKRPEDRSATQFFFLCIVTLGAYLGGYHWIRIAAQPLLLLPFICCAVLLPVVLLHFYVVFPRPKRWFETRPVLSLVGMYGLPAAWLLVLMGTWLFVHLQVRGLIEGSVEHSLSILLGEIYSYLFVAALLYGASVVCLLHSFRAAADLTERNQVKWILFGSLVAVVPIGYSFYLANWEKNDFAAGAATWPMFAASVCFTAAFTISITRYRLMQLDQLISSGMGYFLVSFSAALVYYVLVFLSLLVLGRQLPQAVWVSLTALVLAILLDVARTRFKRALDRRFTRNKHQLDHTLRRMGQAIEQLVDPPTLARRLLQASADLLAASRGAVYLRDGDPPLYRLAGCLGPTPALSELSPGCPLVEALSLHGAVMVDGPGTEAVHRQLRLLGGEVAQALTTNEGVLLALLVLGPKDLGPYGPEDLNLLAAFGQLTSLALESAEQHRIIEGLNGELRSKVEKISEQQRRILALQSQLKQTGSSRDLATVGEDRPVIEPRPVLAEDSGIIGSSQPVRQLLQLVRKVAVSPSAVLLRGESGTGKELLARALHENSPRAGKAFIKVHCAALSPGLLESELFGHVKGAFTGAHRDKIGRFEMANGGTLFLDEIGDINLEVQTKLLRVLQEMTFERVGSSEPVAVDVRIIAATHQDLEDLIRQGRFREDLFYRINVISLNVPALRQRREDIVELALHFLRLYADRSGRPVPQMDDDVLAALKGYSWPGNIRELENVMEQAVVVAEGNVITLQELPPKILQASVKTAAAPVGPTWSDEDTSVIRVRKESDEHRDRDERERERLVRALAAARGNKAEAARALGVARSTLVSRLKRHGLS